MYVRALHYGIAMMFGSSFRNLDGNDFLIEYSLLLHIWSNIAMVVGLFFMATIFGEMNVIQQNVNPHVWDYINKTRRIDEECATHELPKELHDRVKMYFDYLYLNNH